MEFSLTRILFLLKRDCILNGKVFFLLTIALGAVCALMMFISTEEYCSSGNFINIAEAIFFQIFLLGGTLFSNSIFTEFREPTRRETYLNLPSSTFEKWLSKWILAFPIYLILSLLIIYFTYRPIAYLIESIWSECRFIPFSETFDADYSYLFKATIVYQSIAFILGIIFNKYAVLKSIAVTVIITTLFSLFMVFYVKFTSFSRTIQTEAVMQIFIFFVPLLWLISYFLLKRKQI